MIYHLMFKRIDRNTSNNAWVQYQRIESLYNIASKTDNYDLFIRIRPDTFFTQRVELPEIKENDVFCNIRVANNSNKTGMNDWFYIAGKEAAKKLMCCYSLYWGKTTLRGEDMLYQLLIDHKINIIDSPRVTEILPEVYL